MLIILNLINIYPLIITKLEKKDENTYNTINIYYPLKYTLSLEYNVHDNQKS